MTPRRPAQSAADERRYQRLPDEVALEAAQSQVGPPGRRMDRSRSIRLALRASRARRRPVIRPGTVGAHARTTFQCDSSSKYASGSAEMLAPVISGRPRYRIVHLGDSQEIAQATAELRDLACGTPKQPAGRGARKAAKSLAKPGLVALDSLHSRRPHRHRPRRCLAYRAPGGASLVAGPRPTVSVTACWKPSVIPFPPCFSTRVRPAASAPTASMPRIALIGDPVFRVADWRRECIRHPIQLPGADRSPRERALTELDRVFPEPPGDSRRDQRLLPAWRANRVPRSRIETLAWLRGRTERRCARRVASDGPRPPPHRDSTRASMPNGRASSALGA